ncbi:MAG: hypothetical protein GC136_03765 [Alphaproteobacteria bacterium]|nr:hypothetical protein [Alphaproteobacteria bacterium]
MKKDVAQADPAPAVESAAPEAIETEALEHTTEATQPVTESIEETEAPAEPLKPVNADEYKKAFGTLKSENEGALGNRWWQGQNAEFVLKAIRFLPEAPQSEMVRDLSRRVLLTKADPALLAPAADAEMGIKLLQERLTKLVRLGLFDDAIGLYAELPQPAPDALLGPVTQAMIGKNGLSQACIELKTNRSEQHDESVTSLKELETYCGYTLREGLSGKEAAQKYLTSKNIAASDFLSGDKAKNFSLLAFQSWLEAGGTQNIPTEQNYWKQLPTSFMAAGLNRLANIPPEKSLQLLTTAKRLNMISAYSAGTHLKDITSAYFGGSQIPNSSDSLDTIGKFLFLNAKANSVKDVDLKQQYASKAMDTTYGNNEVLIFPFLMPIMDDPIPADFSAEKAKKALEMVESMAWLDVDKAWITLVGGSYPEFNSYILGSIFKGMERESTLSGPSNMSTKPLIYLSEYLDIVVKEVKKFRDSANLLNFPYEKYLDLTAESSYVMPSKGIFDTLNQGVETKSFGAVVLSSLLIIGNKSAIDLYTGLLHNVLTGLNNLGLTKEAEVLGEEALLTLHKKGV